MIDEKLLRIPCDAEKGQLPHFARVAEAETFIYVRQTFRFVPSFAVAAWWKTPSGQCRRFLYSTGNIAVDPETILPDIDEEISALMKSEALSNMEARMRYWEKHGEEYLVGYRRRLQELDAAVCEEKSIKPKELEKLLSLLPSQQELICGAAEMTFSTANCQVRLVARCGINDIRDGMIYGQHSAEFDRHVGKIARRAFM